MMLSIVDPFKSMKNCDRASRDGIVRFFNENRIYSYYVRTENLANDLFAVLTSARDRVKLEHPLTTPEDLRARIPRKNVGSKIEGSDRATPSRRSFGHGCASTSG